MNLQEFIELLCIEQPLEFQWEVIDGWLKESFKETFFGVLYTSLVYSVGYFIGIMI